MAIYFHLNDPEVPLTLDSIGNHWNQLAVQRINGYPCYHWLQTESGEGEIVVKGKTINLKAGDGILISRFLPHSYYSKEKWVTRFVTFQGELLDSLDNFLGSTSYLLARDTSFFSFSQWTDDLITQLEEKKINSIDTSVLCYQFLINVKRFDSNKEWNDPLYKQYVVPVLEAISEEYATKLKPEDLSAKVFISSQYLSRLFKRFFGETTYSYLQGYRLMKAKEFLVTQKELSIKEIAYRTGFSNDSYFISTFRKETGYTPSEFRKLY